MGKTTISAKTFQMFDSVKAFNVIIEQPLKIKVSQRLMKVAEAINTIILKKREEIKTIEENTEMDDETKKKAVIDVLNSEFDFGEPLFSTADFESVEISPKDLQTVSFLFSPQQQG